MKKADNNVQAGEAYEPPTLLVLGSSHELTLAKIAGGSDNGQRITV